MEHTLKYNNAEADYLYVILSDQIDEIKKLEVTYIQGKFELIWEILFSHCTNSFFSIE